MKDIVAKLYGGGFFKEALSAYKMSFNKEVDTYLKEELEMEIITELLDPKKQKKYISIYRENGLKSYIGGMIKQSIKSYTSPFWYKFREYEKYRCEFNDQSEYIYEMNDDNLDKVVSNEKEIKDIKFNIDINELKEIYLGKDSIFDSDERITKIRELDDGELNMLLIYTELGSMRKVGKLFGCSQYVIFNKLKEIKKKLE